MQIEQKLKSLIPTDKFFLTKTEAAGIAAELQLTHDELTRHLLTLVKERAAPAISHYQVGAVAKARKSQTLIFGVNLEFSGQALNQAVHAEQFAIALAHTMGEEGIESFTISAAPCGHCRQFMCELAQAGETKIILAGEPPRSLSELLPSAFGPEALGVTERLLGPAKQRLEGPNEKGAFSRMSLGQDDPLAKAAYKAYLRSHAPYSKSPAGLAVELSDKKIYAGSYLESVAFNPSLAPLQVALVGLHAHGAKFAEIRNALLVEGPLNERSASHEDASRTLLRAIAPHASFMKMTVE